MIHIVKTKKGQFQAVVISSKNGEVLQPSEPETRKANVWKNIRATASEWDIDWWQIHVQDDTVIGEPIVYSCAPDGSKEKLDDYAREPRYIAGRNPKTRTK